MMHIFRDYEPDYDAMWEEYERLDQMAVFYATHERSDLGHEAAHKSAICASEPSDNVPQRADAVGSKASQTPLQDD